MWTANLRTLRIDDAITPRRLITTGLHACVGAAEDIEFIRIIKGKNSAPLPLR